MANATRRRAASDDDDTQQDSGTEENESSPLSAPDSVTNTTHAGTDVEGEAIRRYNEANVKPSALHTYNANLTDADGKSLDVNSIVDNDAATVVTVGQDVYEEFPAPGAPNRTIKRLKFHAGQVVPKSAIDEITRSAEATKTYQPVTETK